MAAQILFFFFFTRTNTVLGIMVTVHFVRPIHITELESLD